MLEKVSTIKVSLKDYMLASEAASLLGVRTETMRRWERAGKIACYRHPINKWRLYRREDLEALLADLIKSRNAPTSDRRPK